MGERGIIFSAPMIRALLDGRKHQTRRVVKWPIRSKSDGSKRRLFGPGDVAEVNELLALEKTASPHQRLEFRPRMKLWVRETWLVTDLMRKPETFDEESAGDVWIYHGRAESKHRDHVRYAADISNRSRFSGGYRSPIHMPRWASRITLEIVSVRVERLQDITEDDARAEGMTGPHNIGYLAYHIPGDSKARYSSAEAAFEYAWDGINGKRATWASNPFVWVISFRKLEAPHA